MVPCGSIANAYSTRTAFCIGEPAGSEVKLLAKFTVPVNVNVFATAKE
jgi:hypothetical protein